MSEPEYREGVTTTSKIAWLVAYRENWRMRETGRDPMPRKRAGSLVHRYFRTEEEAQRFADGLLAQMGYRPEVVREERPFL